MGGSVSMIDGHIDEAPACRPLTCDDAINLWGIAYCRLLGIPCARVDECPESREQEKPEA